MDGKNLPVVPVLNRVVLIGAVIYAVVWVIAVGGLFFRLFALAISTPFYMEDHIEERRVLFFLLVVFPFVLLPFLTGWLVSRRVIDKQIDFHLTPSLKFSVECSAVTIVLGCLVLWLYIFAKVLPLVSITLTRSQNQYYIVNGWLDVLISLGLGVLSVGMGALGGVLGYRWNRSTRSV